MKKNLVSVGVLLLMVSVTYSQSLSPTLLSSQSGVDKTNTMVLEWTLGDIAVETITQKNTVYSQGYIQPYLDASKEYVQIVDEILLFPNPVDTHLNVKLLSDNNKQVAIDIYNVNGRIVKQFTNGFSLSKTFQIDIADLPSGMYVVRISNAKGVVKSHKIIKI